MAGNEAGQQHTHEDQNMTAAVKAYAEIINNAKTKEHLNFLFDSILHAFDTGEITREEVVMLKEEVVKKFWSVTP